MYQQKPTLGTEGHQRGDREENKKIYHSSVPACRHQQEFVHRLHSSSLGAHGFSQNGSVSFPQLPGHHGYDLISRPRPPPPLPSTLGWKNNLPTGRACRASAAATSGRSDRKFTSQFRLEAIRGSLARFSAVSAHSK